MRVLFDKDIDRVAWNALVAASATATWFQTPEAYEFFAAQPELFLPFAYGLENEGMLRGVCVGYVTVEKSAIKQFLTRRALSLVDMTIRLMIADDTIKKHALLTLNVGDFNEVCLMKNVEMITR